MDISAKNIGLIHCNLTVGSQWAKQILSQNAQSSKCHRTFEIRRVTWAEKPI